MIVYGILRVWGLRIMSTIFGAWIDPLLRYTLTAMGVLAVALIAAQLWPRGDGGRAVTQAVTQAVAERARVEADHDKQEAVDDGFLRGYTAQLDEWRRQTAAADNSHADIVIGADDPWLRAKRAAGR